MPIPIMHLMVIKFELWLSRTRRISRDAHITRCDHLRLTYVKRQSVTIKSPSRHLNMRTIPLGLYLFKRLHSLGIRSILGVPGDYNLALLGRCSDKIPVLID